MERTINRAYWVPKIELVSTVQSLLQTRRLRVVPRLALADVLKRELLDFKIKVTASANETFGTWREGAHDDLVLAVAMAAWVGERQTLSPWWPSRGGSPLRPRRTGRLGRLILSLAVFTKK